MKLIGIKYCGGCNPHINRVKLVQDIEGLLPPNFILKNQTFAPWDIGILVCGCLTACADKPDIKNLARKWIIVAGSSVNLNNAQEEALADIVVRKLNLSAISHGES